MSSDREVKKTGLFRIVPAPDGVKPGEPGLVLHIQDKTVMNTLGNVQGVMHVYVAFDPNNTAGEGF